MSETTQQPEPPKDPTLPSSENGAGPRQVVYGRISQDANELIQGMRAETHQGLLELGKLDVRKKQVMDHLEQLDQNTRRILEEEAARLNIPPGSAWELTQDGLALGTPTG